jgi:CRP-like cAMP-binding protein
MNIEDLVFTRKNIHFKEGEVIFNEQEEGEEMYLIDSGEVKIVKTIDDVVVNIAYLNLSSGDIFGEMSLITGGRRVASAIAFTDCNLHAMDKKAFTSNITNNSDFANMVLMTLASRLEEIDLGFALFFKLVSESSKP